MHKLCHITVCLSRMETTIGSVLHRCFAGTPQQMYQSLIGTLSKVDPDTKVKLLHAVSSQEGYSDQYLC